MLCSVKITSINKTFDLALVQWYNYKNNSKPDKYECLWLILTSQYEFIPVESGVEPVHTSVNLIRRNVT